MSRRLSLAALAAVALVLVLVALLVGRGRDATSAAAPRLAADSARDSLAASDGADRGAACGRPSMRGCVPRSVLS